MREEWGYEYPFRHINGRCVFHGQLSIKVVSVRLNLVFIFHSYNFLPLFFVDFKFGDLNLLLLHFLEYNQNNNLYKRKKIYVVNLSIFFLLTAQLRQFCRTWFSPLTVILLLHDDSA